jgi:hypothetical protein
VPPLRGLAATRRLQLVVNQLGVPVALIDRDPLLSVTIR